MPPGTTIAMLADHGYRVFLTNAELGVRGGGQHRRPVQRDGTRQISFDGVEGNQSTAMGNYGEILFTGNVVRLASRTRSGNTTSLTPVAPRTTSGTSTRA